MWSECTACGYLQRVRKDSSDPNFPDDEEVLNDDGEKHRLVHEYRLRELLPLGLSPALSREQRYATWVEADRALWSGIPAQEFRGAETLMKLDYFDFVMDGGGWHIESFAQFVFHDLQGHWFPDYVKAALKRKYFPLARREIDMKWGRSGK